MIRAEDIDPLEPIIGESLDGFVSRVVAHNELDRVAEISRHGGVEVAHRPKLATRGWEELPTLAALLHVDVEELRLRSYPVTPGDPARRVFFGTNLHRADLEFRTRRFAPAALAISSHHRALWQTKVPFDIETGQLLQSRCPRSSCGRIQRWRYAIGIHRCDYCVQDLTETPTESVPEPIRPALASAVGLIHPDPARRDASLAQLAPELAHLVGEDAWELLLRVIPVIDNRVTWKAGRIWGNDPLLLAGGMARAWQTLKCWPAHLAGIIATTTGDAGRSRNDGNGGQTTRFLKLNSDPRVSSAVAHVVDRFREHHDVKGPRSAIIAETTMDRSEAARTMAIDRRDLVTVRRLRALKPSLALDGRYVIARLDRGDVEEAARQSSRRYDLTGGTAALSIPFYGLEELAAIGLLPLLPHPFFAAQYPNPQTTVDAIEALRRALDRASRDSLDNATPIQLALKRLGGRLKPHGAIVEALLAKEIPFSIGAASSSRYAPILVRSADLKPILSRPNRRGQATFNLSDMMTKRDAGEVLNLSAKPVAELFPGKTSARTVPMSLVLDMAQTHISSAEIAERSGNPRTFVNRVAAERGIQPLGPAGFPRLAAEKKLIPPGD